MVLQTRTFQRVLKLRQFIASTAIVLTLLASPVSAQNSKPQPVPVKDIVPAARDIPRLP